MDNDNYNTNNQDWYNPYYSDPQGQQQYYQNPQQGYYQNQQNAYSNSGVGYVAASAADMLNSVLAKSFLYMFIALLITGITSLVVVSSESLIMFFFGRLAPLIVCIVLELVLVFACTACIKKNNVALSAILFFGYSVVNGITLSVIFMVYVFSSIASVFMVTALVFGILAFVGGVLKKDLSGFGPALMAGLIGIIIGSVVNMFIGSSTIDYVINILAIVIFMGITIYDVNKIKKLTTENTGLSVNVLGLYGAMELYLDFINLFLRLLSLFGKRK